MPFKKGDPKPQGSGRKKGSLTKLSREVKDRLESLGCDPIQGMAIIAMDKTADVALRGRMHAELAQYCYPKRRAVEHSGPNGEAIEIDDARPKQRLEDRIRGVADRIRAGGMVTGT